MTVCDTGSAWLPPTLTIGYDCCARKEISLQELVDAWTYQGMSTRFMTPKPLIALHLDRFCRNATGDVLKSDLLVTLPDELRLPFWTSGSNMGCVSLPYTCWRRSVLAHSLGWYLTDDGTLPQDVRIDFADRAQDVVIVWLVVLGKDLFRKVSWLQGFASGVKKQD